MTSLHCRLSNEGQNTCNSKHLQLRLLIFVSLAALTELCQLGIIRWRNDWTGAMQENILVVDDNDDIRSNVAEYLRAKGWKAEEA